MSETKPNDKAHGAYTSSTATDVSQFSAKTVQVKSFTEWKNITSPFIRQRYHASVV